MSEGAIEPTRVYPPDAPITTGRQREYPTYNTREVPVGGDDAPAGNPGGTFTQNIFIRLSGLPGGSRRVSTPAGVPKFLGNPGILLLSWIAAMMMVSLDEWHSYHILPRPARLWYTSLTYMLLALASTIDVLVPITTTLAIGLTIAVGYQYYNSTGQFSAHKVQAPATSATGTPVATTGTGANPGTPPSQVIGG